ncbi:hypothetical protein IKG31_02215 [Candidatus Saccharibacteria bacterium]|nr:hypothetical protein [Candidatus Saccharibacteria bacterium]
MNEKIVQAIATMSRMTNSVMRIFLKMNLFLALRLDPSGSDSSSLLLETLMLSTSNRMKQR